MASPLTATLTMFSIQVGFPVAGILLGDKLLKSQKDKKIRYGLGITAFAFGGWLLSSHFTTKYLENVDITLNAEASQDPRIVGLASVYPNPDFHYKDLDERGYIPEDMEESLVERRERERKRVKNWVRDMEGRGFSYIIREDSQQPVYDDEGNSFSSSFPEFIVLDIMNDNDIVSLLDSDMAFYSDSFREDYPYLFISEQYKEMYLTYYPLNTKRSSHLVRYYPAASLEDLDNLM